MLEEKELFEYFQRVQKVLRENFEIRYGFTDKKRAIDNLIHVFPNGLEVLGCSIKNIKDSKSSMVIKYDPNNIETSFIYHGFYEVNDVLELEHVISEVLGIDWHLEINDNTLSISNSENKTSYFYIKNENLMAESFSKFYEFQISQDIMGAFELSVEGISDKIYSFSLKDTEEKYKEILKLPNDRSLVIFDLPFEMVLDNDRYEFIYDNRDGEFRFVTLRALYGDGRPPLMGLHAGVSFSRVIIIYPFEDKTQDDEEVLIYAINIMNEIIETYRIVTNHYFTPNLSLNDIKEYRIFIQSKGSIMAAKIKDSYSPYFKYENQIKKEVYSHLFAEYLHGEKEILLHTKLISNSKRHFYYQNYQYAILEAVIALEVVVYSYLGNNYKQLGISKNEIDDFLVNTGLTNAISIAILPFIPQENRGELIKLIPKCKTAITMRNKIVHKGLKAFETKDVANHIKTIEKFIKIIADNIVPI